MNRSRPATSTSTGAGCSRHPTSSTSSTPCCATPGPGPTARASVHADLDRIESFVRGRLRPVARTRGLAMFSCSARRPVGGRRRCRCRSAAAGGEPRARGAASSRPSLQEHEPLRRPAGRPPAGPHVRVRARRAGRADRAARRAARATTTTGASGSAATLGDHVDALRLASTCATPPTLAFGVYQERRLRAPVHRRARRPRRRARAGCSTPTCASAWCGRLSVTPQASVDAIRRPRRRASRPRSSGARRPSWSPGCATPSAPAAGASPG